MKRAIAVACFVLLSTAVNAQTVNPTVYSFTHTDFAQTNAYELGYFADATVAQPIQMVSIPKPGTCAPCTGNLALPSTPLGFGTFYAAVRATAGSVASAWSNRVPFELRLSAPANFSVK